MSGPVPGPGGTQPHPSTSTPSSFNLSGPNNPYSTQRGDSVAGVYSSSMGQAGPPPPMLSPTKDINMVTMCRAGQEIVHDIVNKAQEFFKLLMPKEMQLPNNVTFHGQHFLERKGKIEEHLKLINGNFRKLRVIYAKIMEVTEHMDMPPEKELIPIVGQEMDDSEKEHSDSYLIVAEQHREMVEQVQQKNQQLKEVIDSIRVIIWEINTMVTMRGK